MKNLAKTLGATLVIGVISATSFVTIASAHGQNNGQNYRFGPNAERNQAPHNGQQFRGSRNNGFAAFRLVCSDRGKVRIENSLSRIARRINLSAEQASALNNFKTAALSAQAGFNEVCKDFRPAKGADLIARMKSRQSAMAAQLVGMQSVMPSLELFFDSLSDQQKARLRPHMRPHQTMGPDRNGPRNNSGGPSEGSQTNG